MNRVVLLATLLWPLIWPPDLSGQVGGRAAAGSPDPAAEPVLLERIVAIVDEEMVLQSDLDLAVELYQIDRQVAGLPPEEVTPDLRERILDSLIENKLIIAAAKQSEMVVEEEEIESRVQDRVDQLIAQYGSAEALQEALDSANLTLEDFRFRYGSQLRNQQYLRLVVGRFIRPGIEVLANEVEDFYLEHLDEMPAEPDSLEVASIFVRVQPSADARREVQASVAAVQQALSGGQDFAEVARTYSKGPNAARGGRIGMVRPGDLFEPMLEKTLSQLRVDEVSQPVVSSRGVHILRLDGLQADGAWLMSQIFFPLEITPQDVQEARQRLERARERVLDGEAFGLVASEVSEDPASAAAGGRLGTFQIDELSPAIREALAEVRVGGLSAPVQAAGGWYVFQLLDRIEGHRYTFEELKDHLRREVENQKIEAALTDYIENLKQRFFVDIKE